MVVVGVGDVADLIMQTTAKANDFYNGKIKGLDANLKELAKVVQSKDVQLRAIEDGTS